MTAHEPWDDARPRLARELIAIGRAERASRAARLVAADALSAIDMAHVAPATSWLTTIKWLGVTAFCLGLGGAAWRIGLSEPTVSRVTTRGSSPTLPGRAQLTLPSEAGVATSVPSESPPATSPTRHLPSRPRATAVPNAAPVAVSSGTATRDERLHRELAAL